MRFLHCIFALAHQSNQNIRQSELRTHRPETLANSVIENLHRHPRSQQVSRKMACKNAEFPERGGARSTGRNEKPRRARGSAGLSPSQRLVLPVLLAETEGFEPSIQVLPECSLSRGVPSTSRPRLRKGAMIAFPDFPVKRLIRKLFCRVETECLVQDTHRKFQIFFFDNNRNLDFGCGNHLDVDTFGAEYVKHLAGNSGM